MSVIFPVTRTVNESGTDYKRSLNKNQKVRCYFCNKPITINGVTVYISKADGMPIVRCMDPECGKTAPVLYYFDRIVDKKPLSNKLNRKKELMLRK